MRRIAIVVAAAGAATALAVGTGGAQSSAPPAPTDAQLAAMGRNAAVRAHDPYPGELTAVTHVPLAKALSVADPELLGAQFTNGPTTVDVVTMRGRFSPAHAPPSPRGAPPRPTMPQSELTLLVDEASGQAFGLVLSDSVPDLGALGTPRPLEAPPPPAPAAPASAAAAGATSQAAHAHGISRRARSRLRRLALHVIRRTGAGLRDIVAVTTTEERADRRFNLSPSRAGGAPVYLVVARAHAFRCGRCAGPSRGRRLRRPHTAAIFVVTPKTFDIEALLYATRAPDLRPYGEPTTLWSR